MFLFLMICVNSSSDPSVQLYLMSYVKSITSSHVFLIVLECFFVRDDFCMYTLYVS